MFLQSRSRVYKVTSHIKHFTITHIKRVTWFNAEKLPRNGSYIESIGCGVKLFGFEEFIHSIAKIIRWNESFPRAPETFFK